MVVCPAAVVDTTVVVDPSGIVMLLEVQNVGVDPVGFIGVEYVTPEYVEV